MPGDRPFSLSAFHAADARPAESSALAGDHAGSTIRTVAVVGGGVAGLSAACALADAGFRVTVLERRGYPGGRASSYLHPGTGEVIDNCQHVLFGCCTNLVAFYERIGAADKIFWDSRMTLIEPGGRRSVLSPSSLPAPLHGLPSILKSSCYSIADKLSLVFALSSVMLERLFGVKPNPGLSLDAWLGSHLQSEGALERFWRLVIASALNADLDKISYPYAEKVVRELFLNSAYAGSMGMSRVPLSELLGRAQGYLEARGGGIQFNANVESAAWDAIARRCMDDPDAAGKSCVQLDVCKWWFWRCLLRLRLSCCPTCLRTLLLPGLRRASASWNTGLSAACICGTTARLPSSTMLCCWTAMCIGCTTNRAGSRSGIQRPVTSSWW